MTPVKIVKLRLKILDSRIFQVVVWTTKGVKSKGNPTREIYLRSTNDANTGKVWGLDVEGLVDKNS